MKFILKAASSRLLLLGAAGAIILSAATPAIAAQQNATQTRTAVPPISVMLDKQTLQLKMPPIIVKGSLMFPARAIFDAIGANIHL